MARGHWQIAKQQKDGGLSFGGTNTIAVEQAPREIIDVAVKCARLIGDGLYGIDLKQNERGVFVIEINDNPSIDTDYEDSILKDELYRRLIDWFAVRLEKRMGGAVKPAPAAAAELKLLTAGK
jgi:glutathione synthase/RimK-type ligase-like ATP-grasp enzyme